MTLRKLNDATGLRLRKFVELIIYPLSIAILILMLITCTDVSGRYFLNTPLTSAAEMAELVLPYVVFGSMAYALIYKTHVRVTLLTDRLSPQVESALEIWVLILELVFGVWLTWASWLQFWESFVIREHMSAVMNLPFWVGKFSMPLGIFLFTLGLLSQMVYKITHRNEFVLKQSIEEQLL